MIIIRENQQIFPAAYLLKEYVSHSRGLMKKKLTWKSMINKIILWKQIGIKEDTL